ncbi:MAG: glycosyltransferase [bacterium]|nr:glycosyltransferase [bacterium]
MFLSWLIPAHNEERRIEKTIREVDSYLRTKKNLDSSFQYEIILINAGSTDKTQEIAERLTKEVANFSILVTDGRGKGWAVKEGMLKSHGDIRLFSDADNATSPDHWDRFAPLFTKGFDVVIGSRHYRDVPGAQQRVGEPLVRRIAGQMGNLWIQALAVPGIWDTQAGFKAFTKKAAEDIFSKTLMFGFSFDIEVLALARRLKYKINIVALDWKHDPDSKVTMKSYIQVLLDVVKIRWNLITRKYSQ